MNRKTKTDRELSLSSNEFIWDEEGSTENHRFIEKPIIRYLKSRNITTVLDLGCGNGSFTNIIASHGYQVVGLDHSDTGIYLAKKQFPLIHFEQHNIQNSLISEHHLKYDAVVSNEVIEHLLLPRNLIQNAYDALKPGGLFILTTPFHGYWKNLALALTNKFDEHWHPLRDYGHIKFFSKSTILEIFSEFDFKILEFRTVGRLPILARSMIITVQKADSQCS
jgi:2-polyprenyl-3-methyl-5-hydroxy-6-metoxy-1,4-benzoquinol methylase